MPRQKNISRTAIRLHIPRPPLTRQIQQREEDLGVQLFNRTPRGMESPPADEFRLEEARNIRSVLEQATERSQRAGLCEEPTALAAARATANGLLMTQINDHAAFDFALLHFVENLIDIFDRTQRYLRHHLALRGKLEGFGEVLSSADQ